MLKALLIDDEPFILQGLKVLIDWEQEGFEIACMAVNGSEALEYLKKNEADLIIADINMPVMTGLDLLEKIRQEKISDAYFVILSGYADFSYAQQAIRHKCSDYILKPVEREELLRVLKKVIALNDNMEQKEKTGRRMKRAYLARNIISVIIGKYDSIDLEYVKENIHLSQGVCYAEIQLDENGMEDEMTDEEKRSCQRRLFEACLSFLKEDASHCVFDVAGHEKIYDIGFVYCDYMGERAGKTTKEYFEAFYKYLCEVSGLPVVMLVGKQVSEIENVAKSYGTACMLRSFRGFRMKKDIYYYEDEVQVSNGGIVLCKDCLDELLSAIEENSYTKIRKSVERFYQEMKQMGVTGETMNLNINYLLFQLIHLATQQDDCVNQEEILRIISESTFEDGIMRGSKAHLSKFSCEYGEYLAQLRKNVSKGILGDIEKEVKEHYAENLTLRELSEKYYVNSAYLGQLFRKKYGTSFKDYLNTYRIEQAAVMLLRTEQKIYQIAEKAGYRDIDYFVNRFIAIKGCTPTKFRKQALPEYGK